MQSSPLFERNLESLRVCRPQLFEELQSKIEDYRGRSIDGSPFQADEGAENEAQRILSSVDLKNSHLLLIFGTGLGHLPKRFLSQRPFDNDAVLIIEKNRDIFMRALHCFDWSAEISDPSIVFAIGRNADEAIDDLRRFFLSHITVSKYFKILATPSAIQSDPDYYMTIAKATMECRNYSYLHAGQSVEDSIQIFESSMAHILSGPLNETRLSRISEQAALAKQSIKKWHGEGLKILKKIKSWRKTFADQEKSGSPLNMEVLNSALDEILNVKASAANHDKIFSEVAIAILYPTHSIFERVLNQMPSTYATEYELKMDFLLQHEAYFEMWDLYLPRIIRALDQADNLSPAYIQTHGSFELPLRS